MLFSLSIKNFRKSIRDYSIYFFTMILGVAVFYIFNAIETQTAMMEVSQTKAAIIDSMNGIMSGVSIFVSLVLGYLIVYASRFMLKKRKREFGIYLTLGMGRIRLAAMLWLETIWMGLISLAVGLLAGMGISQLMSLIVSNLFQADVSRYEFVISGQAVGKSILYFLLIYLVVMIFNTLSVSRARLAEFITAGRKKEKNFLKKPLLSGLVFLLAVVMLGTAYYNVTANQQAMTTETDVLTQVLLGIFGTFLVFWSLSGFLMTAAGKFRKLYYRRLNSFVVGELSNKLNSTVMACSVICLLLFMTICLLFSAIARKEYKDQEAAKLAPVSISMSKEMTDSKSIFDIMEVRGISMEDFQDLVSVYTYHLDEVTNYTLIGESYGEEYDNQKAEVMKVGDYNRAARVYHMPEYELEEDEYLIVADQEGAVYIRNRGLADDREITIKGKSYHAKENTCQDGYLQMSYQPQNSGILLVPDFVKLGEEEQYKNYVMGDYRDKSKEFAQEMDQNFAQILNPEQSTYGKIQVTTQSAIYDDSIGTSAMYIFLGLYLGICFLISGSAVLALKILSDSADSREKYQILQQLGCEEKEIRRALRRQNGLLFLLPILLAAVHAIFGIQVCRTMLSIYGSKGSGAALAVTLALTGAIYGGYFLLSHKCSVKIVKE
ncbi:MAG TPA: ABC transporter permease [Candidatus Blautia ornithocaccae]|nr:ABC transporter permease [Candidatus Blautia ornithocaccae]